MEDNQSKGLHPEDTHKIETTSNDTFKNMNLMPSISTRSFK